MKANNRKINVIAMAKTITELSDELEYSQRETLDRQKIINAMIEKRALKANELAELQREIADKNSKIQELSTKTSTLGDRLSDVRMLMGSSENYRKRLEQILRVSYKEHDICQTLKEIRILADTSGPVVPKENDEAPRSGAV